MKIFFIALFVFIFGLSVGYLDAFDYNSDLWHGFYYVWDKLKDGLFVLTIRFFVPYKKMKTLLSWVAVFCGVRIVWDLIAITTNYTVAASPTVMFIMFLIWMAVIGKILLAGIKEQWQKS